MNNVKWFLAQNSSFIEEMQVDSNKFKVEINAWVSSHGLCLAWQIWSLAPLQPSSPLSFPQDSSGGPQS